MDFNVLTLTVLTL